MHIGTRGFENAPAVPPELSPRRRHPRRVRARGTAKRPTTRRAVSGTPGVPTGPPLGGGFGGSARRGCSVYRTPSQAALPTATPPVGGAVQEHGSEGRFGLDRGHPRSRVVLSPRTDRRLSGSLRHAYWPRQRHHTICGCLRQGITPVGEPSMPGGLFLRTAGYRAFFFARAACTVASSFSPRRSFPLATICPVSPSTRKAAGIPLTPYRREISASQYLPS